MSQKCLKCVQNNPKKKKENEDGEQEDAPPKKVAKTEATAVAATTGNLMDELVREQTPEMVEATGGELPLLHQTQTPQQQPTYLLQSQLSQPQQVQRSPPHEAASERNWAMLHAAGITTLAQAQMAAKVAFKDDLPWPALYDPAAHFPKPQPLPARLQFVSWKVPSGHGAATGPWCFAPDDELRMVRPVYEEVWKRFLEVFHARLTRKGLLIIGHPGIGKTYLLDLLLSWHLFTHPHVPVVAIAIGKFQIFIKVDGKTPRRFVIGHAGITPTQFADQLKQWGMKQGDPLLVLHDIKKKLDLPYKLDLLDELKQHFDVTCVVSSSPDRNTWIEFTKAFQNYTKFYLPVLSETEARDFVAKMADGPPSDATVSQWLNLVGGVPRHLTSQLAVDSAVDTQKQNAPKVEYDPVASGTDYPTDTIVCMVPAAGYHEARFDFISNNACQLWMKHMKATDPGRLLKALRAGGDDQATRDALGRFFEAWVISLVRSGSCLSRHPLRPGEPPRVLEPWALPQGLTTSSYPGNDPKKIVGTTQDTLWVPESAQFPVVDCVIVRARASPTSRASATLIQVTVASSHHPKLAEAAELFDALTANGIDVLDFVWVVDATSTLNRWQSLEGGAELPAYDNTPHLQWH